MFRYFVVTVISASVIVTSVIIFTVSMALNLFIGSTFSPSNESSYYRGVFDTCATYTNGRFDLCTEYVRGVKENKWYESNSMGWKPEDYRLSK